MSFQEYIHHLSYLGIFLWFLVIEQLTPIPEEVSLISMGYIAMHMDMNVYLCWLISLTALLITDNFLFYLGYKGSVFTSKLLSKVSGSIMDKAEKNLRRSKLTLLTLALLPKLRFFAPIIAGSMKVRWKDFFLFNSLATLFYVTFYMCLGIFFHTGLEKILRELHLLRHFLFIAFMLILTLIVSIQAGKRIRKKHKSIER